MAFTLLYTGIDRGSIVFDFCSFYDSEDDPCEEESTSLFCVNLHLPTLGFYLEILGLQIIDTTPPEEDG